MIRNHGGLYHHHDLPHPSWFLAIIFVLCSLDHFFSARVAIENTWLSFTLASGQGALRLRLRLSNTHTAADFSTEPSRLKPWPVTSCSSAAKL